MYESTNQNWNWRECAQVNTKAAPVQVASWDWSKALLQVLVLQESQISPEISAQQRGSALPA